MRFDNLEWDGRRSDLLRYVGRRLGDVATREDIVQEAFVRFLAYQAKPDIAVANVTGLLRRISLDLIRDHFRFAGRVRHIALTDDIPCEQPNIQQRLEQQQLIGVVAGVLRRMPRLRREVFFRRRVEGQLAKDVAEALGISPGAVDAHVARAVLDLYLAMDKFEKRGARVGA